MSRVKAIGEIFKSWNLWNEDKSGRLRREINALKEKINKIQEKPATIKRVAKIIKLNEKLKVKREYLIQGAK